MSASSEGYNPETLGNPSENGTVFCDATLNGRPLSKPQKNAIEAHEKGHVVRGFKIDTQDISKGFDFSRISPDSPHPNYLRNPDELVERMSQLKNYFGLPQKAATLKSYLSEMPIRQPWMKTSQTCRIDFFSFGFSGEIQEYAFN